MARIEATGDFKILYRIPFTSLIRGHHVYKSFWALQMGEKLVVRPDPREEALQYDKYAIGLYKYDKDVDGDDGLVGHVPIELSSLLHHFLNADSNNFINAVVNIKREIGLVVPTRYIAYTKNKHCAKILDKELTKRKELFKTLDHKHLAKCFYGMFPIF